MRGLIEQSTTYEYPTKIMAEKPETVFKRKVRRDLETLPHTWFVKTQQIAIRGTPDFLLCVGGHFIALELKATEKARVSELQKHMLSKIYLARGYAIVVDPGIWQSVFAHIEKLAKRETHDAQAELWSFERRSLHARDAQANGASVQKPKSRLQHRTHSEGHRPRV